MNFAKFYKTALLIKNIQNNESFGMTAETKPEPIKF